MSNYITIAQFKTRYESDEDLAYLTDEGGGLPSDSRIDAAINEAEATLDMYLRVVTAVPIVTADAGLSAWLQGHAGDLAAYRLARELGL